MSTTSIIILSIIILIIAVLYSSVGHGGASAYLAVMAMFGVAPVVMKPTALILNILVAGIGAFMYIRSGNFSWRVFWPFALGSIPLAFWGSTISISHLVYKAILGTILIGTACWLLFGKKKQANGPIKKCHPFWQVLLGAAIGFLAGLTGIGGGVILSPLLILTHWAETKKTSGVAAAFIFVNSVVGILGHLSVAKLPPLYILYFVAAAAVGAFIGSTIGSKHLKSDIIKKVLAVVLILAGVQLLGTVVYKFVKKAWASN